MRLGFLALLLVACGARAGSPAPPPVPSVEWRITIASDLSIEEKICWNGFAPAEIRPEQTAGLAFARVRDAAGKPIAIGAAGVAAPKGECVVVAIDLDRMARTLDDETSVAKIGDAIYGSLDPWLWRPEPWPTNMIGRMRVDAPAGVSVSLPHERDAGGYLVPYSTWTFMARAAIGRFTTDAVDVAGARLEIANLATTTASPSGIRRFLGDAARAVATVDGRMPSDRVQVLLTPGRAGRSDAVQFGLAMRGAGPAIALRISPAATDARLYGEWITVHELSHLWLPPVDREGAWLSEGLASYYQNVLRSRVGMYSEAAAWDELLRGFDRGRTQAGTTALRRATRPRFQQIYWGGAAILFKLDVALRRSGTSLDAAVARVRRASPDRGAASARLDDMPARAMIEQLGKSGGQELAGPVEAWLDEPFVDTSAELRDLGIARSGSEIVLDDNAPLAAVRRAIAQSSAQSTRSVVSEQSSGP